MFPKALAKFERIGYSDVSAPEDGRTPGGSGGGRRFGRLLKLLIVGSEVRASRIEPCSENAPCVGRSTRARTADRRRVVLPLPKGEGRGEGERTIRAPTAPNKVRCAQEPPAWPF